MLEVLTSTQYLFIVFTTVLVASCIEYYWRLRRLFQFSKNLPGPLALPLIGSAFIFIGDSTVIAKRYIRLHQGFSKVTKLWLGRNLLYLVYKPEYFDIILNSSHAIAKSEKYNSIRHFVGKGLISAPAKLWRQHRKIIAPTLNQKILNTYQDKINELINVMLDIFLKKSQNRQSIDVLEQVTHCTLDIICETMFNVTLDAQKQNKIKYAELFHSLFEIAVLRIFSFCYSIDWYYKMSQIYKENNECRDQFFKIVNSIIETRHEELQKSSEFCVIHEDEENKKSFLDHILGKNINKEWTYEEVADEVATFLMAGTDTNATTMLFVLTMLGMHPDIQEKVYEEVIDVLGPDRNVELEDLPKMQLCERVIKETLRLFPGAPFVGREATADIDLGDFIIPKGVQISLGYISVHRNPEYWPDPYKFDPDRFLPENTNKRHPYTWLPFSGGPRNCVGIKMAMQVMKTMLPMIIRKFKVKSDFKSIEKMEITMNIVIRPKDGFDLTIEPRTI